jgi:hypothetical protein
MFVAFVMFAMFGCGSEYAGANVAQQVQSWVKNSPDPKFAAAVSTLRGDMRRVTEAGGSNGALRTDCDVLVVDALSANQNLPTPDSQLTEVLSQAYNSAANAGRDCLCAGGGHICPSGVHGRANLLRLSAVEQSTAERGLIKAEARVDLLAVEAGGGR